MNLITYGINTAWMWRSIPEWKAYQTATRCVEKTQLHTLRRIVSKNQACQFAKAFQFSSIQSIADYQRMVPLMSDEIYEEMLQKIVVGESQVLTDEPILLLQPTSGTTHGRRLVPYTASLRAEYQRSVAAWIGNLYSAQPQIRQGRAYWSISPTHHDEDITANGLRIGFDDDTAYLGVAERWLARRILVAPADIGKERDPKRFRYLTLLSLLAASDLALISIWSPTFLTALLIELHAHDQQLVDDMRHGTLLGENKMRSRANPRRADWLSSVLGQQTGGSFDCKQLWPKLACISCWMDGASQLPAQTLKEAFADTFFQAKGLMATEGTISFPIVGANGCGLAIRSHFYEFQQLDSPEERCLLAHELEVGRRYTVVLTTGGGLYRYRLHDVVEVTGSLNESPLLRFIGRSNHTSDLVGEKLHETFVQKCINRLLSNFDLSASFAMLIPRSIPKSARHADHYYELLLELRSNNIDPEQLETALDQELQQNFHYKVARGLSQLKSARINLLPGPPGTAWLAYERQRLEQGQIIGNIKPMALGVDDSSIIWHDQATNS